MRKFSKGLALALSLIMALSLVACGGNTSSATPPASTGGTSETIDGGSTNTELSGELTITYSGTPQVHEKEYVIDVFVRNFEEMHGVKVNVEFIAQADAITKIGTEQDTGNYVTDIIYADTANMAPYIAGGWMQPISDSQIHEGTTLTDMFDGTTNKDGNRYFVPMTFDIYILAANVDAIQYLPEGLTEDDVVSGITWAQYAEWANNIAAGEGVGKTMMPANTDGSQLLYPMAGMAMAHGGGFPEFTSQGFKDGMALIAEMAEGNAFYAEQDQYSAPTDPMKAGDVWLTFAHMTVIGTAYNAAENEWVIGAAPNGSVGIGSTSGAWCYGIANGAPNQALAEAWMDYVTTPEVNYSFCYNFGGALSPINEVADLLESSDVVMRAGINMLESAIVSGVPSTEYTDWNAVKLLYHDVFDEILRTGEVPSDETLQAHQESLEALRIAE